MANITDIERLNYYEGEILGAADFQTEQDYLRDMRRRHNVGQHTWGIVSGLDIVQVPNGLTSNSAQLPEVDVYIQPGMAVDGFGREIVALTKTQLTADLFAAYSFPGAPYTIMSVWISYAQVMLNPPADPCTAANSPNSFGRVQEAFALTVTPNGTSPSDDPIVVDGTTLPAPPPPGGPPPPPPQPLDIAVPFDDSIPYQEFSTDDSNEFWYVQIGQVFWNSDDQVLVQPKNLSTTVGREYVGNVTSAVLSPMNSLTIQDRFAPYPLPTDPNDKTYGQFYGGVGVEVAGSLTVDRLLEAKQNVLIDGTPDLTPNPNNKPALSPLTINASSADQSFIQFRDSSGPQFSIWETPAAPGPPKKPAGLNFGETDSSTGEPTTSDLFIQGGKVGIGTSAPTQNLSVNGGLNIDQANQNNGKTLDPGLSFGGPGGGTSSGEGIASNQTGSGTNAGGLDFYTAGTPQLSITYAGNVGIGTQAPLASLDARGQASFQGVLSINHAGVTGVGAPNDPRAAITFGATDTPTVFYFGAYDGTTPKASTILGLFSYQLNDWIQVWAPNGNVGIGTQAPAATLDVNGTLNSGKLTAIGGIVASGGLTVSGGAAVSGGLGVSGGATVSGGLTVSGGANVSGNLGGSGSVGGGETSTGWVLGQGAWGPDNWLRLTTTEAGSTYHDFAVNSFWAAGSKRFDLAEVTPANGTDQLEQGDVVVIDRTCGMQVTRSTRPFDTSVYGVVSSYDQASMVIGGFGGPEAVKRDKSKLPIALVGRAKAKVSDENGPIEVGDLLTTSSTPGHLMRCGSSRCIGSIVGKALQPFTEQFGVITIRVALH